MRSTEQYDAMASKLDASAPPESSIVLVRGSDLRPEPIAWLWSGWLALGKFHVLAGAPGQGKTTIAIACAATITKGGHWPDGSRCEPGNVLMWSGEDDPADTLLPRLMAAGADTSRVFFVKGARIGDEVLPFDPSRDLVQLTVEAERIGNVRLLIVDPVVSAVTGDSHKNTEVRRALQPLVDLGASLRAAVLGISHFTKGSAGRDPTERVTGSVAFSAIARVVLVAAKGKSDNGEDRRVFARSKSNIGPDDGGFEYGLVQVEVSPGIVASRVDWGASLPGSARDLLMEAEAVETVDEGSSRSDAEDALKRVLGSDTVPRTGALAAMKAEGFTAKQIRNARERLCVVVRRSGFGNDMKSYWKLPDGVQMPDEEPPFVPCADHSCPVMPTKMSGTNGHDCSLVSMSGTDAEDF
jgi:putative DNA primase/helicase